MIQISKGIVFIFLGEELQAIPPHDLPDALPLRPKAKGFSRNSKKQSCPAK